MQNTSGENVTPLSTEVETILPPPAIGDQPSESKHTAEPEAESAGEEDSSADEQDGNGRRKGRAADRIRQVIEQRNAERAARLAAEQKLAELQARAGELDVDPTDYESEADYQIALAKAAAKIAAYETRQELLREQAAEAEQRAALATSIAWNERVAEFKQRAPDFEQVVYAPDFYQSPAMADAILDSDLGPEIAYYLARHRDEATRIASLPPVSAAREIGRLEHRLKMASARRTTQAPPPAKTVSGASGPLAKGIDSMDLAEVERWYLKIR